MSDSLVVCDVDPELKEKLKKFRFRKETNNAAIIMKVDKDKQLVVLEEEFQPWTELRPQGPLSSEPHGCKPEQQMMYAGSKNRLVQVAELTKVFQLGEHEALPHQCSVGGGA
ncbi:PREDICTED: glia maturation factor gamma, partial [Gekko japonicus]|uniref:Glia maturation factor n=1 Tax=Gekko japonicus TaxID=146911 RepID=A0ABM1JMG2_GEKJA